MNPKPSFTRLRLCLLILTLGLSACVKQPATLSPADEGQATAAWERFAAVSARAEALDEPFSIDGTLYYSGKEDSQRVSVYFWGNGGVDPHPLRMDILMGPGSVIAQAREDARGIFIYVPRDNAVYHGQDRGLLAFGVPMPFSLADLAFLTTGRFGRVFGSGALPSSAPEALQGPSGLVYPTVQGAPLDGLLTLGPDGLPVAWEEPGNGWRLTIDYWPDSTRPTPRRLHIRHDRGGEATFIVRQLSRPGQYVPAQLSLDVPAGTPVAPLVMEQQL